MLREVRFSKCSFYILSLADIDVEKLSIRNQVKQLYEKRQVWKFIKNKVPCYLKFIILGNRILIYLHVKFFAWNFFTNSRILCGTAMILVPYLCWCHQKLFSVQYKYALTTWSDSLHLQCLSSPKWYLGCNFKLQTMFELWNMPEEHNGFSRRFSYC